MPATYGDRIAGIRTSTAIKAPVRAATTANITLSGAQTIDGVAVVADDRVLVKNQTTASQNGIYTVSSTAWERAKDFDGTGDVVDGTLVWVTDGTSLGALAGAFYRLDTANPITIGTTSLTFTAADVLEAQEQVDLAAEWASKTDGQVDSTDYSAKAWAIGGTGVTDTASKGAAKEWAIETSGTVDGTSYSAKEYAQGTQASTGGSAKNWAQQTGADVTGAAANSRSAKSWAQEANTGSTLGGSSKDWAQNTAVPVDGSSGYSAKEWATGTQTRGAASGGSAKDWATYTGGTVDNAEYSAKYYSQQAASVLAVGLYEAVQDKSADYTIVAADEGDLFHIDTSGANRTITLTAIATLGSFKVAVTKITGDANTVIVQGSGGDTVNGSASYVMDSQYDTVTLISQAGETNWLAIGSGGVSASTFQAPDFFSGDGSTLAFSPLSRDPGSENAIEVFVGGVHQAQSKYSVSGTTLTFEAGNAPASGTNNIVVTYKGGVALDVGVASSVTALGVTTAALAQGIFNDLTAVTAVSSDYVAIADASDSGNKKKALISDITAMVSTTLPTRQVFTSGSGTYTRPANVRQLRIRMIGGGGGGGGGGSSGQTAGGPGGDTSFNSIVAKGGSGGPAGTGSSVAGGAGGTGGTGSASLRLDGGNGGNGGNVGTTVPGGGHGGNGAFGGGAGMPVNAAGGAGKTNSGGGGAGNSTAGYGAAGGGSGEYVELIIDSPSASYSYAVGAAGTAGDAGTSGGAGGAGGSGLVVVDEYY